MNQRTDEIHKELCVQGSPKEVWHRCIGSISALCSWLPDCVEGEYALGGVFVLIWGNHRSEARMTEWNPPHSMAFQWHPGDAYKLDDLPEKELTTVRIELIARDGATIVRLSEIGFEHISAERREWAYSQNNDGWDEELEKLNANPA